MVLLIPISVVGCVHNNYVGCDENKGAVEVPEVARAGRSEQWKVRMATVCGHDLSVVGCKCANKLLVVSAMR